MSWTNLQMTCLRCALDSIYINSVFPTPCQEKDITNHEEFFNVKDYKDNDIFIINQSVICDAINEMSSSSASDSDGLPAIYSISVHINRPIMT